MKTVALISGGKDSCFNMVQCVAEGHQIVALANLRPQDTDELDSYMYQTVGHQAVDLYAEAMGLPLYRHTIQGTALGTGRDYEPQDADEVEDLFQLLTTVQKEVDIEAVAVGAILSDYQRVRVESVCLRLGLTPLAYLWRRDQTQLLQEMVQCEMDAILIKVAALGLEPERHLGLSLQQILPHMMKMQKQYGLNVCGEGGEYETFTLDCPLFHKKIAVDEMETIIHSADAFAPVGYLRFKKLRLVDKGDERPIEERVQALHMTTSHGLMSSLKSELMCALQDNVSVPVLKIPSIPPLSGPVSACSRKTADCFSVGTVVAIKEGDLNTVCSKAMDQLKEAVEALGRTMSDVYATCLYVSSMADFASINSIYKTYFGINPPVRVCVGACLPEDVLFTMDCQGCLAEWQRDGGDNGGRCTMHVQGVSHWAPANIGPYSQATVVSRRAFVAGQIPLVPGTMQLVSGGAAIQCRLSLCHTYSVLSAMCPGRNLGDVLLCVCYVTHPAVISIAREQWEELCSGKEVDTCETSDIHHKPIVEYVVVPSLPRAACVEWQVSCRSEDVQLQELSVTSSDGQVHTKCLYNEDVTTIFSSSTRVYFPGQDRIIDTRMAVSACLGNYTQLLVKLDKSWSDVPLLRIFFPARLFSYSGMLGAWKEGVEHMSQDPVPVSLVPVVQLGDENTAIIMCH